MLTKYQNSGLTWIDIESPTTQEIRDVMSRQRINPEIADQLLQPTIKPKLEHHGDQLFLVLHFPAIEQTRSNTINHEVDFVLSRNMLVTVHYDTVEVISRFAKEFETNNAIDSSGKALHAGVVFFRLIERLYRTVHNDLDDVQERLNEIEEHMFAGKERDMVRTLSEISIHLVDIERVMKQHSIVLTVFEEAITDFFGERYAFHMASIRGEYERIRSELSSLSKFLEALRKTNDSLLTTKQNEVMKTLTIMAFVTFPLSLIAGIFGMNAIYLPIIGHPYDFWIVLGIMGALTLLMFIFFKYKKWL